MQRDLDKELRTLGQPADIKRGAGLFQEGIDDFHAKPRRLAVEGRRKALAFSLDSKWWGKYRKALEKAFKQESIVVRAQDIQLL